MSSKGSYEELFIEHAEFVRYPSEEIQQAIWCTNMQVMREVSRRDTG